jgi:hypothetical protein
MGRTRKELFVVIVVDECFGDLASSETPERPTVGVSRADEARVFDEQLRLLKQEAMCDI